ncbi:thioredoxin domain-containing protein 17-like [Daktulosphaira vitifoliae]|uniref:thioredoxin domain-containing protein 17-like n=1 Tax=Daktulosphaira vitifoliae TaxID=58002 RepID=UPI0021AA39E3|nr:thioredoxin domain-containing protein 17-like [Daktulosphaira vitifoliae]
MVNLHHTNTYDEFVTLMKKLDGSNHESFILFTGTPNESGESWCSDCVNAEPIIKNQIEKNKERLKNANIIFAYAGKREEWKNCPGNPFKTDKRTKLQFLPTLMKWGTLYKLQVEECLKPDLLNMLFEESED